MLFGIPASWSPAHIEVYTTSVERYLEEGVHSIEAVEWARESVSEWEDEQYLLELGLSGLSFTTRYRPWQVEGTFKGRRVYFRFEDGFWRLEVNGETGDCGSEDENLTARQLADFLTEVLGEYPWAH